MTEYEERHSKKWLEEVVHEDDQEKVEIQIRTLLIHHPQLIEQMYSWSEMRRMAEEMEK